MNVTNLPNRDFFIIDPLKIVLTHWPTRMSLSVEPLAKLMSGDQRFARGSIDSK